MRNITSTQFDQAPAEVRWLYTMAIAHQPVSGSRYDEIMAKYPFYFPDEIEHRRKWDSVPQQVKDQYHKERVDLIFDTDEYDAAYDLRCRMLHKKYLEAYGIKYVKGY